MSKTLSVVNTSTDSFLTWITRTNEIVNALAQEVITANTTTGLTTGNGFVNGIFGSNTLVATTLRGGNVSTANVLYIGSNVVVNSSLFTVGNSTVNSVINSTVAAITTINATTAVNVGSNVYITTTTVNIGNSTVNGTINSSAIVIGSATVNALTVGTVNSTFDSNTLVIDTTNHRVGILTLAPNASLAVNGTVNIAGLLTVGGTVTVNSTILVANQVQATFVNAASGNSRFNSNTLFIDGTNSRVGVNTSAPDTVLQVVGPANVSGLLTVGSTTTINSIAIGVITLAANAITANSRIHVGNSTVNAVINSTSIVTNTASLTSITVGAGNSSFNANLVFIDTTNTRVGINIAAPTATLHVAGTANISGQLVVGGNLIVVGNTTTTGTYVANGDIIPISNNFLLGNVTNQWNIFSSSVYTLQVNVGGVVNHAHVNINTTGTSAQLVDSWSLSAYRSADYIVSIKNNSANGYQMTKFGILNFDGGVNLTEYATITSNASLGTFSANANATFVRLYYTPVPANTSVKADRTLIVV